MYLQLIPKHTRKIDLSCQKVTDLDLTGLELFTRLEEIDLSYTDITDGALAELAKAKTLRRINLNRTRTTDEGLPHLVTLPNLEELSLDHTEVSDAGMDTLQPMGARLQRLCVHATRVSRHRLLSLRTPQLVESV